MARAFQARASSALRVWSPSQRLSHSKPASALFHADSAPGLAPSERSPPDGSARVSADGSLRAVYSPRFTRRRSGTAGPEGRDFQARTRPESRRERCAINAPTRRRLPWVFPLQGSPAAAMRGLSSALLSRAWVEQPAPHHLRPRVSVSRCSTPGGARSAASEATFLRFVHLYVLLPFGGSSRSGYVFTGRSARVAALSQIVLRAPLTFLPEPTQTAGGAEHLATFTSHLESSTRVGARQKLTGARGECDRPCA